jgi:hypothetical protein
MSASRPWTARRRLRAQLQQADEALVGILDADAGGDRRDMHAAFCYALDMIEATRDLIDEITPALRYEFEQRAAEFRVAQADEDRALAEFERRREQQETEGPAPNVVPLPTSRRVA